MTPTNIKIARGFVALKKFRWTPGMRALYFDGGPLDPQRVVADDEGNGTLCPGPGAVPDIFDPATVGCLLSLVREAHGDPRIVAIPRGDNFFAVVYPGWRHRKATATGTSEAAALLAALQAAP